MDFLSPIQVHWMDTYIQIHPEELGNATVQLDISLCLGIPWRQRTSSCSNFALLRNSDSMSGRIPGGFQNALMLEPLARGPLAHNGQGSRVLMKTSTFRPKMGSANIRETLGWETSATQIFFTFVTTFTMRWVKFHMTHETGC